MTIVCQIYGSFVSKHETCPAFHYLSYSTQLEKDIKPEEKMHLNRVEYIPSSTEDSVVSDPMVSDRSLLL